MYKIVTESIFYILVPAILLVGLAVGIVTSQRSDEQFRDSARTGLWAGLVAFAIYIVSSSFSLQTPSAPKSLPGFHWIPILIGVVAGFGVLLVMANVKWLAEGTVGLFVLFLVASSTIAEFSYFFASPVRYFAIDFTLSVMFGMLVSATLFSDIKNRVFGKNNSNGNNNYR